MQLSQFALTAQFQEFQSARSGVIHAGVAERVEAGIQCMDAVVLEEERITVCITT
jgi:hypothetical protein